MIYDLRNLQTNYTPSLLLFSWSSMRRTRCPSLYADVVGNPRDDSYIKAEGDARQKIKMKPLSGANVGVAQA